jgi:flavin-binding protein dodecin/predicted RNA-binding Zn-ribbon protein involved in translation (DUF1610 family)
MGKKLLRETRPDIFNMVKDKDSYFEVGVGCKEKIDFICPRCGSIVTQRVNNTVRFGLSCKKCGDGISFGEKFIFNVLEQLDVNFGTHVKPLWSDGKIYDVGIYDDCVLTALIEIHGQQHYGKGFSTCGGRSYQQEVNNDVYKKELALDHGINSDRYVVIDCRISSFDYIKQSVENNIFFKQYDLSMVDWGKCLENAISSYTIKTWDLWEKGYSVGDISKQLKIGRFTTRTYLKQGAIAGLCSYSIDESKTRGVEAIRHAKKIPKENTIGCPQLKCLFHSVHDIVKFTGISQTSIYDCIADRQMYAGKTLNGIELTWFKVSQDDLNIVLNQGFIFVDNPMDEVIVLNFNTTK